MKDYQEAAYKQLTGKDFGLLVAPPGAGKTVLALKLIAEKKQPACIIGHHNQLLAQWMERIESFLGIPRKQIGLISAGKYKHGSHVTIATIQSLSKQIEKSGSEGMLNAFGLILIDECHHVAAHTYASVLSKLHTWYLYGLTATPFRKYSDSKAIFIQLGEVVAVIQPHEIPSASKATIIIRNTTLDVPFNPKIDAFETLSKILIHDTARNKLILKDVDAELARGNKVVIISERIEHLEALSQLMKRTTECIVLHGQDSETVRREKRQIISNGDYQVLLTTGQFFGEGTDIENTHCLLLVYPFSFKGKLIQYIGRVQRNEITPTIYDYRDIKIDYLNKLFLIRNTTYRKIEKKLELFDEPEPDVNSKSGDIIKIDRTIKFPIKDLAFLYGQVSFKYLVSELKLEIEFMIGNLEIRPEFDVLKPYFETVLRTKNIKAHITAEFLNGQLLACEANSDQIDKINQETIESVKFRFVLKNFLEAKPTATRPNLRTIETNNENSGGFINDTEQLLDNILSSRNYRHSRQLRYLASMHDHRKMKIRYVLSPFSFVFLLSGRSNFHIVLETLDTSEATYLWHVEKTSQSLKTCLKEIDQQLNTIRFKGRQTFLETQPANFSRIIHDYSNDLKGFITWKSQLEEQII